MVDYTWHWVINPSPPSETVSDGGAFYAGTYSLSGDFSDFDYDTMSYDPGFISGALGDKDPPAVPEPTTMIVWALLGLAGTFYLRRRGAKA